MSSTPPPNPVPFALPLPTIPRPANVYNDLPCRTCGYNLRTLSADSLCPECATPVALSLKRNFLSDSDPQWIPMLTRGASLLTIACIGLILTRYWRTPQQFLFFMACYLFKGIGVYIITTPDPSSLGENEYGSIRKFVRVSTLINSLALIATLSLQNANVDPKLYNLFADLTAFLICFDVLLNWTQLKYLSKLSLRIPDESLAKSLAGAAWLVCVLQIPNVLFSLIVLRLLAAHVRRGQATYSVYQITSTANLIGTVLLVNIYNRFRTRVSFERPRQKQIIEDV